MKNSVMLNANSCFCAIAVACASSLVNAATLTAIPMQGGMVMPMLSYSAADGRMHVMMDPAVPELTPLLISNPADSFEPGAPWFDALDPSRQSQSFSRRYGFVMDTMSDSLPVGAQMWIRKLSGSPELSAYRYSNTEPKAFEPIFGTAGVTNSMHWNGMMFHPAFAAPSGTNTLTATFETYLVDTVTGTEIPNSSTGPFVFNWTNVSDGRPALEIAQRIVIFWPANAQGYTLEGTGALPDGTWTPVTNAPVSIDGQTAVVLPPEEVRKFFRMKLAP